MSSEVILKEYIKSHSENNIIVDRSKFEIWVDDKLIKSFTGYDSAWDSYIKKEELQKQVYKFINEINPNFIHEVYKEVTKFECKSRHKHSVKPVQIKNLIWAYFKRFLIILLRSRIR